MNRLCCLRLILLLLTFLAGCGSDDRTDESTRALRSKVGYYCTVQFRRDALGAAASNAIPATTGVMNGAEVQLTGLLKDVKGDYLVIETPAPGDPTKKNEYWVPRHSILLLEWSSRPGAIG
jgi:hypothetical protein